MLHSMSDLLADLPALIDRRPAPYPASAVTRAGIYGGFFFAVVAVRVARRRLSHGGP
jgi:hypothetical protein